MYMHVYLCLDSCDQECRCPWRPENPWELELKVVVKSHMMWVLGNRLGFPGKEAGILSC